MVMRIIVYPFYRIIENSCLILVKGNNDTYIHTKMTKFIVQEQNKMKLY